MKKNNILKYEGSTIVYETVGQLLQQVWAYLESQDYKQSKIKIVYSILTELLENIYRYSDFAESEALVKFEFNKVDKNSYAIKIQNPAMKEKAIRLKDKIEFINSLNKSGLKKLYQYEIKKKNITQSGSAGLGLIIIARKLEVPMEIELKDVNSQLSVITIKVIVKL